MNWRGFAPGLFISLGLIAGCNPVVPTPLPTFTLEGETAPSSTALPTERSVVTRTPLATGRTPTPIGTLTPTATRCAKETTWKNYIVQVGDTLELLADLADTTKEALMAANCLIDEPLIPGDHLYTPIFIIRVVPNTLPPGTLLILTRIPSTCPAFDESCGNGAIIRRPSPTPWSPRDPRVPVSCSPPDVDCVESNIGD
jgi:hypothetical protein